jgi:hypothetical protein
MTTAFTKATLYNLWHRKQACGDCIEWCCEGEARPALRANTFYLVRFLCLLRDYSFILE